MSFSYPFSSKNVSIIATDSGHNRNRTLFHYALLPILRINKIPYVLKELDFTVQVNENSNERLFTLENYVEDLYSSQGKLDNVKGLFSSSLAAKITEIAIIIGYDAFKETFRSINILHESNLKRFELFIEKLSEYSSKNIKEMFTNEEWNTIVKNLS